MSIFFQDKKFIEHKYKLESDFENRIFENSAQIFGPNTILLNIKKKINSGELGKTIPDGFLFDFNDPDDPRFYLLEVELQSHDFYRHIFPQITKFFGFVRSNNSEQEKLIDALYRVIESNEDYKKKFKAYLKDKELFKFLKDLIESAGDILLIIDGRKPEIEDIKITYADTWGKYVKLVIARTFMFENQFMVFCEPDFEIVESITDSSEELEIVDEDEEVEKVKKSAYSEAYHLADCTETVKEIYNEIKVTFSNIIFNPQAYYISMKNDSNFAYLTLRKKLLRVVVLMPIGEVAKIVKSYPLKEPSEGVQRFYNAKCTEIKIDSMKSVNEIIEVLKRTKEFEKKRIR